MTTLDDVFPELELVENGDRRDRVVDVWASAIDESAFDSVHDVPWWPPHEAVVGTYPLVDHVRDVVQCAVAVADALSATQPDLRLDRDVLVAGALLHDVSKPSELTADGFVETHDLLPHPHYSVHLLERSGVSKHVQHVVLAHSSRSGVTPVTLEAMIVSVADSLATNARYWATNDHLATDG